MNRIKPTSSVTLSARLYRSVGIYYSLANVKEHATPLAGAGVETVVEVHATGDVADSAASGGCCVSTCCASSIFGVGSIRWFQRLSWQGAGNMFQVEITEAELDVLIGDLPDESQEMAQHWGSEDREDMVLALILLRAMNAQEAKEVLTCYQSGRSLPGTLRRNRRSQKSPDADQSQTSPCSPSTSPPGPDGRSLDSSKRPASRGTTSSVSDSPETA